jgi:hypothetical protein
LPGGDKSPGKWSDPKQPGNSSFTPDNPERWGLKPGESVPFENGYPLFSNWSERRFEVPALKGEKEDFSEIHKRMHELYPDQFKNPTAAKNWLRAQELTPHHVPGTKEIELIPRKLNQLPHKGGAYDLRLHEDIS